MPQVCLSGACAACRISLFMYLYWKTLLLKWSQQTNRSHSSHRTKKPKPNLNNLSQSPQSASPSHAHHSILGVSLLAPPFWPPFWPPFGPLLTHMAHAYSAVHFGHTHTCICTYICMHFGGHTHGHLCQNLIYNYCKFNLWSLTCCSSRNTQRHTETALKAGVVGGVHVGGGCWLAIVSIPRFYTPPIAADCLALCGNCNCFKSFSLPSIGKN